MRNLWLLLLFFPFLAACGSPEPETSDTSALVYNNPNARWPNPRLIPVCIVNRNEVGDRLFWDVVNHVKREYASRVGIGLVGFGPCNAGDYNSPVIRVYFSRIWDWVNINFAGGGLSMVGKAQGSCGPTCFGGTMRLDIGTTGEYPPNPSAFIVNNTRGTAIHEFGHALGLFHEHQRTDESGCQINDGKIPNGGDKAYIGPFDPNSIMSYCHAAEQTQLSAGDVEGLQWFYPITKDLGNSVTIHTANEKCMDIDAFSFDPQAKIQQWACNGNLRNQLWRFRGYPDGSYEIRSSSTDLCLDVQDQSRENGAKVQQWFCTGSENQRVRIIELGGGWRSFQFVHSRRCLDVDSGKADDGIQLQQWDCSRQFPQYFYFIQAT